MTSKKHLLREGNKIGFKVRNFIRSQKETRVMQLIWQNIPYYAQF